MISHEGADGSWELTVRRPSHPALRPHVLVLEGYEERLHAPAPERHLPSVVVPLILNFGPAYRLLDPADARVVSRPRSSFVAGIGDALAVTESSGNAQCVQVNLTPLGARRLFGVPMHELENRVLPLEDLIGPEVQRLEERFFDAADWETRLRITEEFLAARLEDGPRVRPDVVRAWHRLAETDGRIRVEALARELRCSRKHLLAQFREHVGPGPKTVARLLRFNRLLRLIGGDQHPDWSDLAYRCGYADQSHLNREVRRFAALYPGRARPPAAGHIRPRRARRLGLASLHDPRKERGMADATAPVTAAVTVFPFFGYDDAVAAIDWLEQAFGFERGDVSETADGKIAHAELWFGSGGVMLGSGTGTAGGDGVYVVVEDIVEHYARARAAGAEIVRELHDTDYGSRDYMARDPAGRLWAFGTYQASHSS